MTRDDEQPRETLEESGAGSDELDLASLLDAPLLDAPLLDAELGPARPLSEREQLLLVDRIERQFVQRGRVLRWRAPRRVVLAGALFAASAAAAVYGVGILSTDGDPRDVELHTAQPRTAEPSAVPPSAVPPSAVPPSAVPPSAVPPVADPAKPSAPLALPPPAAGGAVEPAPEASPPAALDLEAPASARPAERDAAKPTLSGSTRAPAARATGADRLAAASALRARHRYREALALYLQVIELDPDGVQASVARVAAAEVQLDHLGDIAGAERLYREVKTQGGELTAEAQFGLAQVARARGDATGERQALQDFLTRHPGSPLVSAARRRLSALGAR